MGPKKVLVQKSLGQTKFWTNQNFNPKKSRPAKNWVQKVWSVTAEIILIRANVARTYDAWTSVTMAVGIC